MEVQRVLFTVFDSRNGSHHHRIELVFNEVALTFNVTLGRGADQATQSYGPFAVDYLEVVEVRWEMDGSMGRYQFEPVCHPSRAIVTFRVSDSGAIIRSDHGVS